MHDQRGRRQLSSGVAACATHATSWTRRCSSCATRRASAASTRLTACTWVRARSTAGTRYTIGPDGSLYACPGFTGEPTQSTGHIDGRDEAWRRQQRDAVRATRAPQRGMRRLLVHPRVWRRMFRRLAHGAGDMHAPSCHKGAFESAFVSLAQRTAAGARCVRRSRPFNQME